MGYTTEFEGEFDLDRPLTPEHGKYLQAFNRTRRMKRDAEKASLLPDVDRQAVGLPVGVDGAYYVGSQQDHGQDRTADIINYNEPPTGQPGLWCQWIPTDDLNGIHWDEGEKFYNYIEWIEYLIEHFLKPWGYIVNGHVDWSGEDRGDIGRIVVDDNVVSSHIGEIVYR